VLHGFRSVSKSSNIINVLRHPVHKAGVIPTQLSHIHIQEVYKRTKFFLSTRPRIEDVWVSVGKAPRKIEVSSQLRTPPSNFPGAFWIRDSVKHRLCLNILGPPAGNRTAVVQPLASHFSDW